MRGRSLHPPPQRLEGCQVGGQGLLLSGLLGRGILVVDGYTQSW